MSFLKAFQTINISEEVKEAFENEGIVTLTDFLLSDLETMAQRTNCSYRVRLGV